MAEKYKKHSILIGCVGKPNAGKSSFLNSATDAKAKVGNYPFTTIEPNQGIAYHTVECACKKYGKEALCAPRYGKCENGKRYLPVKVLDVAGLIPGASEGLGLGNKFLDDLRTATVLLHVVDVSGTTNEKGEQTKGYDPTRDVEWLQQEIHSWIFNNLWKKWGNIVRKHLGTRSTAADTIHIQFSGYGTKLGVVQRVLDTMGIKEPSGLETWDKHQVEKLVWEFMKDRFPTILVLNKVDHENSDKNIAKICAKYGEESVVPCSALAECFLKKLREQGFIHYIDGEEAIYTKEDEDAQGSLFGAKPLIPLDEKTRARLEKVQDSVQFRFGGTGVADAIKKAVNLRKMIPVYWVKNMNTFQCDRTTGVFRDCTLIHSGTTAGELFHLLYPEQQNCLAFIEDTSGQRVAETEIITLNNNILKFSVAVQDKK